MTFTNKQVGVNLHVKCLLTNDFVFFVSKSNLADSLMMINRDSNQTIPVIVWVESSDPLSSEKPTILKPA